MSKLELGISSSVAELISFSVLLLLLLERCIQRLSHITLVRLCSQSNSNHDMKFEKVTTCLEEAKLREVVLRNGVVSHQLTQHYFLRCSQR